MSSGINKVTLVGNLGATPEVRYTQGGTAVCNLRLACNERRKKGDAWEDHTEWVDVVCWDKTAENVGQYLDKGRQIYVEGRLQTREYTDKEGAKRFKTEVVAGQVLFLGANPAKDGRERAPSSKAPGVNESQQMSEDLPF